jgi:imidazolonepropionase-like amidohydrolase
LCLRSLFQEAGVRLFLAVVVFAAQAWAQLALVGATVYPGPDENPIANAVVVIEQGKITAVGPKAAIRVPSGARVVDCSGLTVTAGFSNSHVHFMERKWNGAARIPAPELTRQFQAMLTRWGFTTVFDTGSSFDNTRALRARVESGEVAGPRIRTTGEILFPKGGAFPPPILDLLGYMRFQPLEVSSPEDAPAAVDRQIEAGVDAIKVYAATWAPPILSMSPETVKAIAAEAHRRGKLVFAHPSNRAGLTAAVYGGADILVHTAPQAGPWDAKLIADMRERRVALIPTLQLWKHELRHERISEAAAFLERGVAQLRAWVAAGGAVLFGTDVGYTDAYDPADEYSLMAEAGMSFRQILAALTTAPAERFADSLQGRVAPGSAADLVVLNADPAKDVRAFANVHYTIRAGRLLYEQ